jgi:hypothetical protein
VIEKKREEDREEDRKKERRKEEKKTTDPILLCRTTRQKYYSKYII